MAETITITEGYGVWTPESVIDDLVVQGGLKPEALRMDAVAPGGEYCLAYSGKRLALAWAKDEYVVVKSHEPVPDVVDALSSVVGYFPCVRYKDPVHEILVTEWELNSPEERIKTIRAGGARDITVLLQ